MKIKFIFTGLIVAVLAAVPGANVIAQNDERPAQQDALTAQSTRAERDAERKVRLSDTDLSEARLERTVSRCSVAQNKLATASEQAKQVQRNRTAKYAEISQKLDVLVTRLPKEIDTAELEVSIATYNQLVATLTEGIDQYVIAFSDVASIDCEENTEEFLLALADVRAARAELKTQAQEIKTLLQRTIIKDIRTIKASLSTDASSADDQNRTQ